MGKTASITAADMGRLRWRGITLEERQELMRRASEARWGKTKKKRPTKEKP